MIKKLTYILALIFTLETLCLLEAHKQQEAEQEAEIVALNQRISIRDEKISELSAQNEKLKARVNEIEIRRMTSRGGERELVSLGEYTITAYCSCEKCCGRYAINRPGGKVYGAAGIELTAGVSVAAPLPIGTEIYIDGRRYVVQDRTAEWITEKYNGRIIDIYFNDHDEALAWGKQKAEVFIYESVHFGKRLY